MMYNRRHLVSYGTFFVFMGVLIQAVPSTGARGIAAAATTPTVAAAATVTATTKPVATATATVKPVATASPTASVTASHTPVVTPTVALTVTAMNTTVNRGGLVIVTGKGFAASEVVALSFTTQPKNVTTTHAAANGTLPPTGVTVPYAFASGTYTITVVGLSSKRHSTVTITVQQLTPSVALDVTTAHPGSVLTLTGKGFGAHEMVTLALNGAALNTIPAPLVTAADGSFRATVTVPSRLLSGPNTISAVGNASRVGTVASLTGVLPTASILYFTGGVLSASEQSTLDLLNPHGQPSTVRLTFFFGSGATDVKEVKLDPTSHLTLSVASLEKFTGPFGVMLTADRSVSAQLVLSRDGKDGDSLLGNTGLDTRWYLAEGYTGLTFKETVSILNPDFNAPAQVILHLRPFSGHPGRDVAVTVPPHAVYLADINALLPNQSLSVVVGSNRPVAVERTLTFSNDGYGMTTRAGTNTPATSWIFAEGTTTNHFETFLTIYNPNNLPTTVTASFFNQKGFPLGSQTLHVLADSRVNLKLNSFLHDSGIASVVTSDQPIVVERPEYFGSPNALRVAGSDVFGRNGGGVSWSFPAGQASANTREFLLLYNPSAVTVPVMATFYTTGGQTIHKSITVSPTARLTVDVNQLIPGLAAEHGIILQSVNGQGFIAEQTVFAPDYSTLRSTEGSAE